jgi:hypothetical protein
MLLSDIRFLFAYDRWATTKVLAAAAGRSPGDLDLIDYADASAGAAS